MEYRQSKPLRKIESLAGALTWRIFPRGIRALDVDLLFRTPQGWIVIEFLRALGVPAFESHPRRYWAKNWRKFVQLWRLAKDLHSRFFLVNYEASHDSPDAHFGNFLIMRADMTKQPSEVAPIVTREALRGGLPVFSSWIVAIDDEHDASHAARCPYCKGVMVIDAIGCTGCARNACAACVDEDWRCEECLG